MSTNGNDRRSYRPTTGRTTCRKCKIENDLIIEVNPHTGNRRAYCGFCGEYTKLKKVEVTEKYKDYEVQS